MVWEAEVSVGTASSSLLPIWVFFEGVRRVGSGQGSQRQLSRRRGFAPTFSDPLRAVELFIDDVGLGGRAASGIARGSGLSTRFCRWYDANVGTDQGLFPTGLFGRSGASGAISRWYDEGFGRVGASWLSERNRGAGRQGRWPWLRVTRDRLGPVRPRSFMCACSLPLPCATDAKGMTHDSPYTIISMRLQLWFPLFCRMNAKQRPKYALNDPAQVFH